MQMLEIQEQPRDRTAPPVVTADGLTRRYGSGDTAVDALRGVSVDVAAGGLTAVMGPSGSGKSTLMHILGCLDSPSEGRYWLDGEDVATMSGKQLARIRNQKLGFVFQTFNLLPRATILKNVELPLLYAGVRGGDRRERAMETLKRVGLEKRFKSRPNELSGGQRQRVAIARAMAGEPRLVLADEPTANLDSETAERILDLLAGINATTGCTFVFSTHDAALIARAERVIRIRDGRIAAIEELLEASA